MSSKSDKVEKWERQMFTMVKNGVNDFDAMKCAEWARKQINNRTLNVSLRMRAVILFTNTMLEENSTSSLQELKESADYCLFLKEANDVSLLIGWQEIWKYGYYICPDLDLDEIEDSLPEDYELTKIKIRKLKKLKEVFIYKQI